MQVLLLPILLFVSLVAAATITHPVSLARPNPSLDYGRPVVADIDGDGLKDIVFNSRTSSGSGEIRWSKNQGNYVFSTTWQLIYSYPLFGIPLDIADLDNDGDNDVVCSPGYNGTSAQIVVNENLGNGVFFAHTSVIVPQPNTAVGFFDFDNDGLLDIAVLDSVYISVFHNDRFCDFSLFTTVAHGKGWIGPADTILYSKEFPRYSNILFIGSWATWNGYFSYDGSSFPFSAFGTPSLAGTYNTWTTAITDLNGDSYPDYVAGGYNCWDLEYFLNNNGVWSSNIQVSNTANAAGCYARNFVAAGDIDGNGYGDIIFAQNDVIKIAYFSSAGQAAPITLGSFAGTSSINGNLYSIFHVDSIYSIKDIIVATSTTIEVYTTCQTCVTCPANSFVNIATGACTACPAGTKSNLGATKCLPVCHKGQTYTNPGCTVCPAGSYSAVADAPLCTRCKANEVSPGGTIPCSTCPANTYPAGRSQCLLCPTGTYSAAKSLTCTPCPPGSIRNTNDATCSACPAGSYASSNACQACPAGTYSNSGSSSCTPCASGYYAGAPGSTSCTQCPAGQTSFSGLYCD